MPVPPPTPSDPDPGLAFAQLRLATLARTPGALPGSAARARLLDFWRRGMAKGAHHALLPGRAQLFAFADPSTWFGGPCVIAVADRHPAHGDPETLAFLADALTASPLMAGDDVLLEIAADDPALLALALERGLGIDSVIQVGHPARARARLGPTPPLPADLSLRPLERHHVEAVIALHRETFAAQPEYCWFGAWPAHLEGLAAALGKAPAGHAVLVSGSRVLGHIGVDIEADDPFWGSVGGLELVLAPELRGRGLLRTLYAELLDGLVSAGCEVMKGGTSQPAVLHLGQVLGRPWHALNLRRGVAFQPEHFFAHAPRAIAEAHRLRK
jgi:GNAT superfamily N-acetyltransferase